MKGIDKKETLDTEEKEDKIFLTLTIITWITGLLAGGMLIAQKYNYFFLVVLSIASITGFLIKPTINIVKESRHRLISLKEKVSIGLKFLLVIIGIQSAYIAFLLPVYDVYWSYWIFLGSFSLLLGMEGIKERKKENKEEEEENPSKLKKFKKTGYFILSMALAIPNFYQMYTPEKIITLENLNTPQYMALEKVEEADINSKGVSYLYHQKEKINIRNNKTLEILIEKLDGATFKNTRYIDELNYLKMQRMEKPYYTGYFHYEEDGIIHESLDKDKVDFLYGIEIYPNNKIYLEFRTGGRRWTEVFETELENDIIDMLLNSR